MEDAHTPSSGEPGPSSSPSPMPSVVGTVVALFGDIGQALHGRVELLSLEVRRAGLALTQIIILAAVSALLLCSAWLVLMVGIYMAAISFDLHWSVALAIVLFSNLLGAAVLWWRAYRLSAHLMFPATVRTLKGRAAVDKQLTAAALESLRPPRQDDPPAAHAVTPGAQHA